MVCFEALYLIILALYFLLQGNEELNVLELLFDFYELFAFVVFMPLSIVTFMLFLKDDYSLIADFVIMGLIIIIDVVLIVFELTSHEGPAHLVFERVGRLC